MPRPPSPTPPSQQAATSLPHAPTGKLRHQVSPQTPPALCLSESASPGLLRMPSSHHPILLNPVRRLQAEFGVWEEWPPEQQGTESRRKLRRAGAVPERQRIKRRSRPTVLSNRRSRPTAGPANPDLPERTHLGGRPVLAPGWGLCPERPWSWPVWLLLLQPPRQVSWGWSQHLGRGPGQQGRGPEASHPGRLLTSRVALREACS